MTHHTLQRDGVELHYWLDGPANAPLVTLLHGAGLDHRTWAHQVDAFTSTYRVLRCDLRGHGASRPLTKRFDVADVVDDVIALLDAVGAERTILIGLSMGGNVAQEVVFRHPARVRAMVCLGCACNTLELTTSEKLLRPFLGPLMASFYAYPRRSLMRMIAKRTSHTPEGQAYVAEAENLLTTRDLVHAMSGLFKVLHHEPGYTVEIPELIMRGDGDKLGNFTKAMPKWHARDKTSELVVVPEASHAANQDNPAFFNRTVLDWLERVLR